MFMFAESNNKKCYTIINECVLYIFHINIFYVRGQFQFGLHVEQTSSKAKDKGLWLSREIFILTLKWFKLGEVW